MTECHSDNGEIHRLQAQIAALEQLLTVQEQTVIVQAGRIESAMKQMAMDITERKRVENDLRLRERALFSTNNGVLITDPGLPDNPIVYVNPAVERLTGYRAEEILGRNCRFLQGPDTDPAAKAEIRRALWEERDCRVVLKNYRKDGSVFWNDLTISPVRDGRGQLSHFVGVQVDITEQKDLQEQLFQSQKMEAVGRLAGGIAHDFNNLLTVVTGYSEVLLARLSPTDRFRKEVTGIKEAGDRAAALTKQLLAFSRRQAVQATVADLNNIVTNLVGLLRRLIGEHIVLATRLDRDLHPVKVDPGQFEQVLVNLAVNARDAMPDGGVLTIETHNRERQEPETGASGALRAVPYVSVVVRDSGCGIDPQARAHIFEPFFTTKEVGKGTGLGLATVYGMIAQCGGSIDVDSEPGRGSTFTLWLPRAAADHADVHPMRTPMSLAIGTETILLVEDDRLVREYARDVLTGHGYRVLEAGTAEEALRSSKAHEGPIHLLVTDVVMPRMNGRQLSDQVTTARPATKVLFMSGYTGETVVGKGLEHSPFLQKPIAPDILLNKVRELLNATRDPSD